MRDAIERLRRLVITAVQTVAAAVMLGVLLAYWNWTSIKNLVFRESLVIQAQKIRALTCPLEIKEVMLDELETLMDELHEGKTVGVLRWMEFHEAVEAMFKDGITSDEQRLIERECERLERELQHYTQRGSHD